MTEEQRINQRCRVEDMTRNLTSQEQKDLQKDINELTSILNSEYLSSESIALLIYCNKHFKRI